jgi:hypothetical protein
MPILLHCSILVHNILNYPIHGSSVNVVTRLENRHSIPGKDREFSPCYHVQTDSGSHPASYPKGTWGYFSGVKRPGREAYRSLPSAGEGYERMKLFSHSSRRLHSVVLN